jgi:hypothetical protein
MTFFFEDFHLHGFHNQVTIYGMWINDDDDDDVKWGKTLNWGTSKEDSTA